MSSTDAVHDLLGSLPAPDRSAGDHVAARAAAILRPSGALQRFDDLAEWVACWQRSDRPEIRRPAALIFAADHGVAAAGVSAYPAEVTAAMVGAFESGVSSINALGRVADASVAVVDVGVGHPTADISKRAAMDGARFSEAFDAGRRAVMELDTDLLVLGEMGIGNTTAAAALCAATRGGTAGDWVGRGTGVDDDGLARKTAIIDAALARVGRLDDPLRAYLEVGGAELVALAGATIEARRRSIPVLLDGFPVTAAVAPLACVATDALAHCRVSHRSAEPGHQRLLHALQAEALVDLGFRLGEGSGAMTVVPLVKMACAAVVEVPTFAEFFTDQD